MHISLHRVNTCCNSINECVMIRQVFVVSFGSGGDDASYHRVDSSPCRINPCVQLTDHPPPTFCFIIAHHEIFNRKLLNCHIGYRITIQWKPGVHIYTHLTYCLPIGQLYVGWKNVYFYGLKSLFPCIFFYAYNKMWPHHWKQSSTDGVWKQICCTTIEQ